MNYNFSSSSLASKSGGPCVVSVLSPNHQKQPPPLPAMPPPSTNQLSPPILPPPPPPQAVHNHQNNSSISSYSSSSSSSSASSQSNYLQPKAQSYQSNPEKVCSFSTNNLNRLKFSNISNQPSSSSFNIYQPHQKTFKNSNLYSSHSSAASRSLTRANNDTTNSKSNTKDEQNYSNLQQALRAATAALQKSKTSTNIITSQPISKSNMNLTNSDYQFTHKLLGETSSSSNLSFQPFTKSQSKIVPIGEQEHYSRSNFNSKLYKNTLNLLIENNEPPKSGNYSAVNSRSSSSPVSFYNSQSNSIKKYDNSDYDNIEDNIDISVNLNCLNSNVQSNQPNITFNSHNSNNNSDQGSKLLKLKSTDEISLLDETGKTNSKFSTQENESLSTLSSPSSMSSSKSSTTSCESSSSSSSTKLSHQSDTRHPALNSSEISSQNSNPIFQSKRSAFSSALNLNEKKFSDYFYGNHITSQNNVTSTETGASESNNSEFNNLNAHMTKFFNKNLTKTKQKSASIDHLNLASCFSKSSKISDESNNLISTPFNKDFLNEDSEDEAINSHESKKINCLPPPNIQPFSGVLSKSLHSLVLKPQPLKPIIEKSTANKKNNVTIIKPSVGGKGGSCFSNQQYHHMKPVSSTTQPSSYRDSFFKSKCASTTNLFTDVKTYQVAHPVAKKAIAAKSVNFLASKLSESESSLGDEDDGEDVDEDDDSSSTTSENVGQFEIVVDSNKTKNIDPVVDTVDLVREKMNIEAERVAYEQKLNEMRVHFNQKLSMFEDNERKIMQDRINTLQGMYNDLKFNFQKNLETDVKSLRSQLSESQSYSAKLMSELNKCTCHKEPLSNSTAQINSTQNSDLSLELKKAKIENNELKLKLDSERRHFHVEREKWLNEKQKVIQFQSYLQQQREQNESNFIGNNQKSELPSSAQSKKGLASHMQFLQQKLSMNQKNHNQQFQQSQKDYFKTQQTNQSKLIAQSLMASTANPKTSQSYRVKQQSAGLTGHQKFL